MSVLAQPIGVQDLLAYLLEALDVPLAGNPIVEVGGPDRLSYLGLMQEYARQRGLRRWMIPVPFLTPTLSSWWLGLVTPVYARVFSDQGGGTVVRKTPGGAVVTTVLNDVLVEILPETEKVDGVIWVHVNVILGERKIEGWILQNVLVTATPAPSLTRYTDCTSALPNVVSPTMSERS